MSSDEGRVHKIFFFFFFVWWLTISVWFCCLAVPFPEQLQLQVLANCPAMYPVSCCCLPSDGGTKWNAFSINWKCLHLCQWIGFLLLLLALQHLRMQRHRARNDSLFFLRKSCHHDELIEKCTGECLSQLIRMTFLILFLFSYPFFLGDVVLIGWWFFFAD